MNHPAISITCVSNVWIRMMVFKSIGDTEQGHKHQFDHVTLLSRGSLQITVDGNVKKFEAPHLIFIQKDKNHELIALEDNTIACCIHALRVGEKIEDIVDPAMLPSKNTLFV